MRWSGLVRVGLTRNARVQTETPYQRRQRASSVRVCVCVCWPGVDGGVVRPLWLLLWLCLLTRNRPPPIFSPVVSAQHCAALSWRQREPNRFFWVPGGSGGLADGAIGGAGPVRNGRGWRGGRQQQQQEQQQQNSVPTSENGAFFCLHCSVCVCVLMMP